MLAYPAEPFDDEGLEKTGLLMRQRVSSTVQHRERGARIVLDQIPLTGVSHDGVLAPRDDQGRVRIRRHIFGALAEEPAFAA